MGFGLGCSAAGNGAYDVGPGGGRDSGLGGCGLGLCLRVDCILKSNFNGGLTGSAQALGLGWVADVPFGKPGDLGWLGHAGEVSAAVCNCALLKMIMI